MMYGNGQGVPQDFAEAAKWYRKAALQGHGPAQYALGLMYYNGQGVRQDNVQAHLWFSLKTDAGDAEAARHRDMVTKLMTPEQIAKAEQLAGKWRAARPAP